VGGEPAGPRHPTVENQLGYVGHLTDAWSYRAVVLRSWPAFTWWLMVTGQP
jgi:hypothetical protein